MMALSEARTCALHGSYTAKVLALAGDKRITSRCPACEEYSQAESSRRQKEQMERARLGLFANMVARSNIPVRFRECTVEGYQVTTEASAKALERVQWYVQTISQRLKEGTSLIFTGSPGCGKTHLATAIARAAIDAGSQAQYVTSTDMLRAIRSTYGESRTTEAEMIARFVAPALLVIDEIGGGNGSDHERQMTFEVINKRYEEVKPTILVSNLDAENLRLFLGERIIDRLRQGGGKMVVFDWQSYRK